MDLRQLNDYDLVTVYVYDQLFSKKRNKDRKQPSHLEQTVGNHKQHRSRCTMNLKKCRMGTIVLIRYSAEASLKKPNNNKQQQKKKHKTCSSVFSFSASEMYISHQPRFFLQWMNQGENMEVCKVSFTPKWIQQWRDVYSERFLSFAVRCFLLFFFVFFLPHLIQLSVERWGRGKKKRLPLPPHLQVKLNDSKCQSAATTCAVCASKKASNVAVIVKKKAAGSFSTV